ncbi:MAG: DUF3825 domain-containing protein [Hungatella sp.]|nr:DUF3825 domain-containing protein [Hungatella sp.]
MGTIRDDVFLGKTEKYNQKLEMLAKMAQPEKWTYKKIQHIDPYRILRNYIQFTYNRIDEENKFLDSLNGNLRCMNTGLLTSYNQEIVAIFAKNNREGKIPWFLNGFFKETDKFFTTNFLSLPLLADYCNNVNDLIYDNNLELKPRKEHIIDDNFERFCDAGYFDKQLINALFDSAIISLEKKLKRNFKLALPFYYHNTETGERKIQLLAPLYFPGAPVRLALVLNKIQNNARNYYEGVTVLPVEWAYMNSRLIVKPDEEWAKIMDEIDSISEIDSIQNAIDKVD